MSLSFTPSSSSSTKTITRSLLRPNAPAFLHHGLGALAVRGLTVTYNRRREDGLLLPRSAAASARCSLGRRPGQVPVRVLPKLIASDAIALLFRRSMKEVLA